MPKHDEHDPARPLRVRHDGWTAAKREAFLHALAETGCVRDACRAAGTSSTTAYRWRKRDPALRAAWSRAEKEATPRLEAAAYRRAVDGVDEPIVRGDKVIGTRKRYSDGLLRLLIERGDLKGSRLDPERVLSFEEWRANWRFDNGGVKYQTEEVEAARARLKAKFDDMHRNMLGPGSGCPCPQCDGTAEEN